VCQARPDGRLVGSWPSTRKSPRGARGYGRIDRKPQAVPVHRSCRGRWATGSSEEEILKLFEQLAVPSATTPRRVPTPTIFARTDEGALVELGQESSAPPGRAPRLTRPRPASISWGGFCSSTQARTTSTPGVGRYKLNINSPSVLQRPDLDETRPRWTHDDIPSPRCQGIVTLPRLLGHAPRKTEEDIKDNYVGPRRYHPSPPAEPSREHPRRVTANFVQPACFGKPSAGADAGGSGIGLLPEGSASLPRRAPLTTE